MMGGYANNLLGLGDQLRAVSYTHLDVYKRQLYDRMHSRRIADYGGVVNVMPRFATFFILFSMANSGLPATSGFVGEFMAVSYTHLAPSAPWVTPPPCPCVASSSIFATNSRTTSSTSRVWFRNICRSQEQQWLN